jgi:hypothetical protein
MYMLPAAVGKIYGVYAAHLALLAQNAILFSLILYFIVPVHIKLSQAAMIIVSFVLFSGLDVVPTIANYVATGIRPSDHLEPWAGLFQYSSHITQLFWVPHHAIAGWAFACLYLLWQRGYVSASILACVISYLAYWSPFALIGAAPFVLYAAISDLIDGKISRVDIAFLSLTALPVSLLCIYLVQGDGTVVHGFLVNTPNFWNIYFSFICIEFIPYAVLIVAMRPMTIREPTFLLIIISLLLIPFYKIGESNDFAMRASIPALALLAAHFSVILVESHAAGNQLVWTRLATLILIIGSITGAMEVRRALIRSPQRDRTPNCRRIF